MSGGRITVICGGVGAAKLLTGLVQVVPADRLTAIVNVADDMVMHGLNISPDLDTVVYTVSGQVSRERGWGLEGESWQAMEMLGHYGGPDWFSLGDRDLGTHLFRTGRLASGAPLHEVTAAIASAWGLDFTILPVTNDPVRTMVTTVEEGEISFQQYFVGRAHSVPVTSVRFDGATEASPAPGVLAAISDAERIIIAPSNPAVSIDPVLAVPGVADGLRQRRDSVVAVSPIVAGKALKGPADRLLVELGREASVVGVASWYRDLVGTLVVDTADRDRCNDIAELGMAAVATNTIMSDPAVTAALAEELLALPITGAPSP
ncbi:MAG: 2-phospho-L-lactate transferase [Actinomycetota bacterium]